ncbi:Pheromone/general odorant binding protein [Cinara cedri]|uniref:Pheromone/general odorant binding protein n=1 Tax=Cinara cedri TaxID=506608 RepID=A0A5E4LXG1_9HEMI|nr:Pheromone/general odorant binding protein [Cinara cedri]
MYFLRVMMCLCLSVSVVLSASSLKSADNNNSDAKIKSCLQETNFSYDEFKVLVAKGVPETQAEKCMTGCMLRILNMINNLKFTETGYKKLLYTYFGTNEEIISKANTFIEYCAKQGESEATDECSLAGIVGSCVAKEASKNLKTNRKKKRLWTRKWLLRRDTLGNSVGILRELDTEDQLEHRSFMRITPDQFEFLLQKISRLIQRENTIMRLTATPARIKRELTCSFLATALTSDGHTLRVQPRVEQSRGVGNYLSLVNRTG